MYANKRRLGLVVSMYEPPQSLYFAAALPTESAVNDDITITNVKIIANIFILFFIINNLTIMNYTLAVGIVLL